MKANGRIDILNAPNHLSLYDTPKVYTSSFKDALQGNLIPTPLSTAYFSVENQQIIQNGIRAGVYKMSSNKYVVSQQPDTELKIIMRAMFLAHSENRTCNIKEQIQELNQYVLDYCIPHIYGEAQGYINYLRDASTIPIPLNRPIISSTSKTKTLELKPFF
jgi:hypothetical protein